MNKNVDVNERINRLGELLAKGIYLYSKSKEAVKENSNVDPKKLTPSFDNANFIHTGYIFSYAINRSKLPSDHRVLNCEDQLQKI